MYRKCPKCGHDQGADTFERCARCGLIFEKWLRARLRPARAPHAPSSAPPDEPRLARFAEALLEAGRPVSKAAVAGRAVLWIGFLVWGIGFIGMDHKALQGGLPPINYSIMHSVNLVFHEAGHVIFRLLGDFMTVLGGSLAQLLMPAIVAGHMLLQQRDPFGASIGLWWLGQSLLDLAPYINDARAGRLLLLGGGTGQDSPGRHDWHNILGRLGMLEADHALASVVYGAGAVVMIAAFVWGALVLRRQYGQSKRA